MNILELRSTIDEGLPFSTLLTVVMLTEAMESQNSRKVDIFPTAPKIKNSKQKAAWSFAKIHYNSLPICSNTVH